MAINITTHASDVYEWRAIYLDGTQVPEFDEKRPEGRGFAEIDSSQVVALELLQGQKVAHRVSFRNWAIPVFVRRRKIVIDPNTQEESRSTVHCIGWKHGEDGSYLFINEDGSTLLTSNFQAV